VMQNASQHDRAPSTHRREGVQAIARAGLLLRALERHPDGLALGELSVAAGLPKSTVHRLVAALAAEDLVSARPGARIVLGSGLARLGAATARSLPEELRPVLERLRQQVDETVDLAVLDGDAMRFVDQLPAGHRLRAVSAVGVRFPLHCTANGKALLAAMPARDALALLPARLPRTTPNTIASRSALLEELERIRRRGVAFDREEHTQGICAVGAAVTDDAGPVAAISVPVPTPRFAGNEKRYAAEVKLAAQEASRLLRSSHHYA